MPAVQPIHALVVDYGEVLCRAPDPQAFAAMARVAGVELGRFTDAYWHLRPAYDRGELDGPAYWRLLGEVTESRVDTGLAAELVEQDIALWAQLDEAMLAWVNDVAEAGTPVGLLSNMVPEIGVYLRDTMRLFDRFSSVTYSYEVGLSKPDPGIYHDALARLGVEPHEALFVDDRPPNVEAARSLGMHAHLYRGREALFVDLDARYALVTGRS